MSEPRPLTENDRTRMLSEIQRDINQAQIMVLYYQNQILRKKIAIEEIWSGQECRMAHEPIRPALIFNPSVTQMIGTILPELNGSQFRPIEVCRRCQVKYPSQAAKIDHGMTQAFDFLKKRGIIDRVGKGLYRVKIPTQNPTPE